MGDIKTRADFESDKAGIDSNTISAGEDNLFIIISALVSLRYYYANIISNNEIESILLIDEFDATLHPSLQFKLLDLFRQYSASYKIQVIFTTHSLSSVEYALKKKDNIIYLIDNITSVIKMDSPDIYKIKIEMRCRRWTNMPNTYSLLRYPGGKTKFYTYVRDILECNGLLGETYIEPFAGGAGLALKLLLNNDVKRIVINDFDPAIYCF